MAAHRLRDSIEFQPPDTKEALIHSANEMKHETPGTQQLRHINKIGEDAHTVQRSDALVQSINERFPKNRK